MTDETLVVCDKWEQIDPGTWVRLKEVRGSGANRVVAVVSDTWPESAERSALVSRVASELQRRNFDVRITSLPMIAIEAAKNSGSSKLNVSEWARNLFRERLPVASRSDGTGRVVPFNAAWPSDLLTYISSPPQASSAAVPPCLVLWGGSGRGKTVVLQQLGYLLQQMRSPIVPVHFSAALYETSSLAMAIEKLEAVLGRHAASQTVLCIDDFDAAIGADAQKLAKLLMRQRCRRVLVVNDYYARSFSGFRKRYEKRGGGGGAKSGGGGGGEDVALRFEPLEAKPLHIGALRVALEQVLGRGNPRAAQIASSSGGDMRAVHNALIVLHTEHSEIQLASSGSVAGVWSDDEGGSGMDLRASGSLHYSLFDCMRSPEPVAATRGYLRDAVQDGDVWAAAETLFVNAPLIARHTWNRLECDGQLATLDALADAADHVSEAAAIDVDGALSFHDPDSLVDLGAARTAARLAELAVTTTRLAGAQPRSFVPNMQLELSFPTRNVAKERVARAEQYEVIAELIGGGRVVRGSRYADNGAEDDFGGSGESGGEEREAKEPRNRGAGGNSGTLRGTDEAELCDAACNVWFGALRDGGERGESLLYTLLSQTRTTDPRLAAVALRAHQAGLDAAQFHFLCRHVLAMQVPRGRAVDIDATRPHFNRSTARERSSAAALAQRAGAGAGWQVVKAVEFVESFGSGALGSPTKRAPKKAAEAQKKNSAPEAPSEPKKKRTILEMYGSRSVLASSTKK